MRRGTTSALHAGALGLGLLAGCALHPELRPDEPLIEQPPPAPAVAPAPSVAPPAMMVTATLPPGEIARSDYERVLQEPPGAFLARISVEPTFRLRAAGETQAPPQFLGWTVRRLDPRFGPSALRRGDVIVKVDGRSVERPEQFAEAWRAARGQSQLTIDVVRDGKPQQLVWRIVDR